MALCDGAVCVGEAEQHILARPGNGCEHQGKPERRNQAGSGLHYKISIYPALEFRRPLNWVRVLLTDKTLMQKVLR